MPRVSRHVDTVGELVFDAHVAIDSKPVLQRENRPHSGTVHMLVDDELGYFRTHLLRRIAPPTHLLVVETLSDRTVFLPPSTQRVHVVRTCRADRLIRSVSRMCELDGRVFRHTLDLQTEDLQFVHHIGHASRYHTKILAATKHMRRVNQCR